MYTKQSIVLWLSLINEHCTIVATNDQIEPDRYILEIVAQSSHAGEKGQGKSLEEHYQRAQAYHDTLGATATWVIHFKLHHPSKGYDWPEKSLNVGAIHVYHDLEWTEARVVTSPDDTEGTLIKLIQ
jgi:hypothetical protein